MHPFDAVDAAAIRAAWDTSGFPADFPGYIPEAAEIDDVWDSAEAAAFEAMLGKDADVPQGAYLRVVSPPSDDDEDDEDDDGPTFAELEFRAAEDAIQPASSAPHGEIIVGRDPQA